MVLVCEYGDECSGDVEVDDSYLGARRVRGKRGRGAAGDDLVKIDLFVELGIWVISTNRIFKDVCFWICKHPYGPVCESLYQATFNLPHFVLK